MFLTKIISGGQSGADTGGLVAAERVGIKTGGWMPYGFRHELSGTTGRTIAERFGLEEHASRNYFGRTRQNVLDSDGTIIISKDMKSPGTQQTMAICMSYKKPHLEIVPSDYIDFEVERAVNWILNNNIGVLNVAGNRESKAPGLQVWVVDFLEKVFIKVLQ